MNKKNLFSGLFLVLIALLYSCSGIEANVDITLPKGPKGDSGLSAYEVWKESVNNGTIDWPKNQVGVTDFFKFLKGKDGKDGKDGENGKNGKSAYQEWKEFIASGNVDDPHSPGKKWDPNKNELSDFWRFLTGATGESGQTPRIGENGNWWIGGVDTNVPARGKDGKPGEPGKDAEPPVITIGENGNWFINGVDTGKPSRGKDGENGKDGHTPTVTIGENGNWFIDGKDTGKPSKGADGHSPTVAIGENGNWFIDGKDTGISAYGKDGKSAYELWKKEVADGYAGIGPKVKDPKDPTKDWPKDKVSKADFWEYLRGKDGKDGKSAYEVWKENVDNGTIDWPKDQTEVTDFFKFLKGKDGTNGINGKSAYELWVEQISTGEVEDPHNKPNKWDPKKNTITDFWRFLTGATGENGQTPHIGDNGNWWIGDVDTGKPSRGEDGKPGKPGKDAEPPVVTIGENGNWFINGVDTGKPSRGNDGHTPTVTIGENGNWFIDGKDTGKPSKGADGKSPEVAIGENGNWFIDGKDTGKPAYGKNGKDGKSAYELWKEEVAAGYAGTGPKVKDPKTNKDWPKDKVSQADFWEFLRGKDGKDGDDGATIELGKPNVLPVFYNGTLKEYVNPKDGSVLFDVFDKEGKKLGKGVKVKGLPGVVDSDKVFETDENGQITVPRTELPDNKPLDQRKGSAKVEIEGVFVDTPTNTLVPNRVNTRIKMEFVYLRQENKSSWDRGRVNNLSVLLYKYERKVDGKWVDYPAIYPMPDTETVRVTDPSMSVDESNVTVDAKWGKANVASYSFPYNQKTGSRHLFFRPVVLTETEKTLIGKNLNDPEYSHITGFVRTQISMNLGFAWDNTVRYMSIRGKENFYGEQPIMPAAIHVPEIYPVPLVSPDDLNRHVGDGSTILWGKINLENMPKFFLKYEKTGDVWKAVEQNPKDLPEGVVFGVGIKKSQGGSGGSSYIEIKPKKSPTKGQFVLTDAYEDNPMGGYCYIEDPKGTVSLGKADDRIEKDELVLYRDAAFYKIVKTSGGSTGDTFKLVDLIDHNKAMPIGVKPVSPNWMILVKD